MRPTVEQLIASIFQQESGRGKADTSKPNYAGAQGPMQVTAPTFEGMKAQGTIPADWSLSNPEQAREAGNRHVRMLWNQYGGDPAKVAAAYYSGPKAITSSGIKDFSDPKNPKAPTTHGYVRSVLSRMGASAPAAPAATAAALPPAGTHVPRLDDPLAEVMPGRAAYPKGNGKSPIPDLAVPATPGVQPVDQVAEAKVEAGASAALSKEEDVSFLEQTRRAWISWDLLGAAARRHVANEILGEDKPDPSFRLDIAALRNKLTSEQEFLQEATNTKSYEYRVWAINQQREDAKMAAVGGVGRSVVASLVAGLPLGAVSGLAAARTLSVLKAGSAAYMAQGRTGAAVGSMLAENAGLEVLMATAQNKIDPFFTTEDAVVQVGVGTLLGAAFGSASLIREGTAAPRLEALQDAQASARLSQVLPEHADAQQAGMAAEAAALRVQEDSISRAAQPPESPVLPETVRLDFEEPELAASAAPATGSLSAANDSTRGRTVLPTSDTAPMRTWEQLAAATSEPSGVLQAAPWAKAAVESGDIHVLPAGSVLPDYPKAAAAYSSKLRKTFVVDGAKPDDIRNALLGSYGAQQGLAQAVGDDVYAKAMAAVDKLAASGNKTAAEILRRVPGSSIEDMEFRLGLFVEAYPKTTAVTKMLDALSGWWGKLTGKLDMTAGDLLRVIEGSVKSKRGDVVAFSGGPRNFDEFSTEYVGTGEGNISQGWGLYFSESPSVADWYRKKESLSRGGTSEQGVTYKVSIARSPDEFLDWAGNSSPRVKQALESLGLRGDGEQAYRELMGRFSGSTGEQAKQASMALSEAGVAGTSYRAGAGRVNATNYVAYSDKDVKIAQKFMGGEEPLATSLSKDDPSVFSKLFSALARVFKREDDFGTMGRADTSFEGWDSSNVWAEREKAFSPGGKHAEMIPALTFGKFKTIADLDALPAGIHLADKLKNYGMAKTAAEALVRRFLGKDFKLVIADADGALKKSGANGAITHIRENLAIINIDTKLPAGKQAAVMVHELGHAIWHKFVSTLTPEGRAKVDAAYQRMVEAKGPEQARKRFANSSNGATMKEMDNSDKYSMSRDEFSAEQYVKYIEDDVLHGNKLGLGEALKNALFEAVAKMVAFFTKAKQQGFVKAEPEYEAMFDSILRRQAAVDGNFGAATAGIAEARQLSKDSGTAEANAIVGDPELAKLGLDIAPVVTPQQRAEVQAIKDLHDRAKNPEYAVDEKRLSTLLNTAVFQGGQSVANTLLRSKNAVARMIAAMLVESPSGAAGRRGNAAISKALHEQAYLGNSINEVQFAYREYRQSVGGSLVEDTFGGKHWEEFNALVSRELEGRGRSQGVTSHPAVVKGADAIEAAYERMRLSQLEVKTVGWASLPSTGKGYMPHRLSQEKIRNATNEQLQALHTALTDQFIRTQEFDASFSDMLASKYIDRVKHRALGGADTPAGATHIGSSDVVEEALVATGMTAEQVRATMQRLMRAGPGHTKKRLQLDLNQTYSTASGGEFKLGDLFEQDQFTLLRSQAARVSGEVSLTQYGVYGKAGLDLLRRAMTFGEEGPASKREFEAFDQIAAEFLGTPYGTQSKVIDRVLQANAVSRLGGMGFTQLAEFINGAVHVGVGRTLDAVVGVPRLLGEIKALARGEEVQNGILTGMEKLYGGAEFGTQSYKTVFPFDNKSLDPHSYGEETITLMDRLLRGASHMQAKLSFWRAIHSAQQRGMAEQIVRKAAVFLREGQSADVFLKDMGMSDDLLARMRVELPSIASWDAQGRLVELDVTKATDLDAAREFTQAVHRGVSQIIQGTFIGERSQWATDAHMRLLTQFRAFGLLAIEKQYGRQVGNVGEMKTLGLLLGSMCAVLPIYAARMQLQSLGREDREEFLDKAFEPRRVARQTMNYVAGSGLAGDFLDALGGLAGVNVGGRQGDREQEFVGNVVAPAAGLLDDAWKAVQNVQEGETNLQPALKVLTNLPYLVPLINAMGD